MEIAARARLRPNKDEDLIRVWKRLPPHEDKSDIVRKALRLLFFGGEEQVHLISSYPSHSDEFSNNTETPLDSREPESVESFEEKLDELFGSM
ncbi:MULTISPECIES: hypothetical protein [Paenibacillus]|uniref:hypothetical protein n=1 Tax=Paenibacillus TaxID=44249 RepID=UPI000B8524E5|nr:hypothetical protein [Paenibacillus amylolyticus]